MHGIDLLMPFPRYANRGLDCSQPALRVQLKGNARAQQRRRNRGGNFTKRNLDTLQRLLGPPQTPLMLSIVVTRPCTITPLQLGEKQRFGRFRSPLQAGQ